MGRKEAAAEQSRDQRGRGVHGMRRTDENVKCSEGSEGVGERGDEMGQEVQQTEEEVNRALRRQKEPSSVIGSSDIVRDMSAARSACVDTTSALGTLVQCASEAQAALVRHAARPPDHSAAHRRQKQTLTCPHPILQTPSPGKTRPRGPEGSEGGLSRVWRVRCSEGWEQVRDRRRS